MEININFIPRPLINESVAFGKFEAMIEGVKAGKHIIVDVSYETKTRAYIAMQVGTTRFGVNIDYPNCAFKLHEKTEYSYATYKYVTTHHFVLSKKQNFAALLQHIKNIIEHFFAEYIDKVDVDIWQTSAIKEIKEKYS